MLRRNAGPGVLKGDNNFIVLSGYCYCYAPFFHILQGIVYKVYKNLLKLEGITFHQRQIRPGRQLDIEAFCNKLFFKNLSNLFNKLSQVDIL